MKGKNNQEGIGVITKPAIQTVVKIAKGLGITIDDLIK